MYCVKLSLLSSKLLPTSRHTVSIVLDSGDPARPGKPAKTGNTFDCEPELCMHHAGLADLAEKS
jgi:hypothetical protein